jgi:hypothetical protein
MSSDLDNDIIREAKKSNIPSILREVVVHERPQLVANLTQATEVFASE